MSRLNYLSKFTSGINKGLVTSSRSCYRKWRECCEHHIRERIFMETDLLLELTSRPTELKLYLHSSLIPASIMYVQQEMVAGMRPLIKKLISNLSLRITKCITT